MGHTQPGAGGGEREDQRVRRVHWEPGGKDGAKSPGKSRERGSGALFYSERGPQCLWVDFGSRGRLHATPFRHLARVPNPTPRQNEPQGAPAGREKRRKTKTTPHVGVLVELFGLCGRERIRDVGKGGAVEKVMELIAKGVGSRRKEGKSGGGRGD